MGDARTADRQEIHDALMRYCRGVDRGDAELTLSAYHAGAVDDHGPFYGLSTDFVATACIPSFEAYDSMMHCLTNEFVEFEGGDVAHSETYFIAYMRRTENGTGLLETMAGRYVDRFERHDGEWRIAHRVVVYEWGDSRILDGTFPPNIEAFEHGRRSDSDIAYTRSTERRAGDSP